MGTFYYSPMMRPVIPWYLLIETLPSWLGWICALLVLLALTYLATSLRFQIVRFLNRSAGSNKTVRVIPYGIPFLGHAIPMLLNPSGFVQAVVYVSMTNEWDQILPVSDVNKRQEAIRIP